MRSHARRQSKHSAKPRSIVCRLAQDPEFLGYVPPDNILYQFRFDFAPSAIEASHTAGTVEREWWVSLKISYTVVEYLDELSRQDAKKVYFAFVREKLMEGQFTPGESVALQLSGNKGGRRFRKGVPYRLEDVNLHAPFAVPAPVVSRKPSSKKKTS